MGIILIPAYKPDNNLILLLKDIDKHLFEVVIVDDGSGEGYQHIFRECEKFGKVISYTKNRGKGYALKTGFKYILDNYQGNYVVITMDSDGQHLVKDAVKIYDVCKNDKNSFVIGKRIRNRKTPIRSRIGNRITSLVFKIKTGKYVYDTQSGLRGFSSDLLSLMLNIDGDRFEYEMNVLLACAFKNIPLKEEVISTIYIDNNKGSHFKIFKDSYKIYRNIFRYKK